MMVENESLSRLERLEKENRRIKLALIFCLVLSTVFAFVATMGYVRTKNTVDAKEFLLRDQSGQIVARFGSRSVGTCLEVFGKTKNASATLCAGDESGSGLALTTNHGESRAVLSAGGTMYESIGESMPPSLIIAKNGEGLVNMTVGTDQGLRLARQAGANSILMSVPSARPSISLLDKSGRTLWSSPQTDAR